MDSFYYSTTNIPPNILNGKGADEDILEILKPRIYSDLTNFSYRGELFHLKDAASGRYFIKSSKATIAKIKRELQ